MAKETEWDKFNESMKLCGDLGCSKTSISVCCPELMGILCKPKSNLLKKLNLLEEDLDKNKITYEQLLDIYKNKIGKC